MSPLSIGTKATRRNSANDLHSLAIKGNRLAMRSSSNRGKESSGIQACKLRTLARKAATGFSLSPNAVTRSLRAAAIKTSSAAFDWEVDTS